MEWVQGPGCIGAAVAILQIGKGDVNQTKEYLASLDGAEITGIEDAVFGGAPGIRFEYTNELVANQGGQIQADIDAPLVWVSQQNEQYPIGGTVNRAIVTVVDVGGQTMTVVYQGLAAVGPDGDDAFDRFLEEGISTINSIIWEDLS